MPPKTRRPRDRGDYAARLIGLGLMFVLLPMLLGKSPMAAAFKPLAPLGWLALAAGGTLFWWQRREAAAMRSRQPPPLAPAEARSAPALAPHAWSAGVFEVIEWRRFEAVIEALFSQAGFQTKAQSHGADEGIDIWLYSRNNPNAAVSLVQCKHWRDKVGVDKIRELRGVMAAKGVSRGQFATTSTFSDEAKTFAKENGINLLDVQALLALIGTRSAEQQYELLGVALQGEYWKPTCVNCGTKMVERTPRKGGAAFWGCTSYPKCKKKMPKRAS